MHALDLICTHINFTNKIIFRCKQTSINTSIHVWQMFDNMFDKDSHIDKLEKPKISVL